MLCRMSTEMGFHDLPDWDVADRLAKSLRHSKVTVNEMAAFMGVHRNTVSGWINGRTPVNERTLKLWAERTGWPLEWLRTGEEPPAPPPPPARTFREPQAVRVMRRLQPATDVAEDRSLELVRSKDRWSWYAEALAEPSKPRKKAGQPPSKPVGCTYSTDQAGQIAA